MALPPTYGIEEGPVLEAQEAALPTFHGILNLSDSPPVPDADTCLAHLRLLSAFEKLKIQVGYQDGLWDIWDDRASSAANAIEVLVKLREKRWALYVARAVDRYEAWWTSFVPTMLLEKDMIKDESSRPERYEAFVHAQPTLWKEDILPPIGTSQWCLQYGMGSY